MNSSSNCLVCQSTNIQDWANAKDIEYFTTDETFNFFKCLNCNVLFINPVPLGRLSQIYPDNYYSFVSPKSSLSLSIKNWLDRRLFKKMLSQIPGESLRILDVGGGAGWQLNNIRAIDSRIKKTCIVDLDSDSEKLARNNGHEYFCGQIEDYETNEKFDLIMLLNIIEHVSDPGKVLAKIQSMLSPDGLAIIKTPNYDSLDAKIFRSANWGGYHCPRHWVLFNKESFEVLASQTGLQVVKFSYTQGAAFWATSVLFWLHNKGLIRISKEKPVIYHPLFSILSAGFAVVDFMRMPFSKTSQMFFVLKVNADL